jgi:hypothetical protein
MSDTPAPKLDIVPREKEVQASAVTLLKELLEKAQTGEIQSVMVVSWRPNGRYRVSTSDQMDGLKKIGALNQLLHDFMHTT